MKLLPTGCTLKEIIENAKIFALKVLGTVISFAAGIIFTVIGFQDNISFKEKLSSSIMILAICSISFIILSFFFAIVFQWINIACRENEQLKENAIMPIDYSFTDIKAYIIKESETRREYFYKKDTQTFDVRQILSFKIQGGVENRNYIIHKFTEEDIKENDCDAVISSVNLMEYKTSIPHQRIKLEKTIQNNTCDITIKLNNFELKTNEIEYKIEMWIKGIKKDWLTTGSKYTKSGSIGYKKMIIKLKFEQNISINNADCDVVSTGSMKITFPKEIKRTKTKNFYNDENDIEMVVNNPIPGLDYILKYDSLETN